MSMADKAEEQSSSQGDSRDGVLEPMDQAVPEASKSESEEKPVEEQKQQDAPAKKEEKKPSKVKQLWEKSGLDV